LHIVLPKRENLTMSPFFLLGYPPKMNKNKTCLYQVVGNSMFPVLKDDDVITTEYTPLKKIQINDIIAIRKGGGIVIHRVVYKSSGKSWVIYTHGDNNDFIDQGSHLKDIIGKVAAVNRNGKTHSVSEYEKKKSTVYQREIEMLITAFAQKEISYIFLKGLPLYLFYSQSPTLKSYQDCDILIKKEAVLKVIKQMNEWGYVQTEKNKPYQHEITFYKVINSVKVVFDIHVELGLGMRIIGPLYELYPKQTAEQFSNELLKSIRMVMVPPFKTKVPLPVAEMLILFLFQHLFRHNFMGASRYGLISEIVQKEQVDYKKFVSNVRQYKLSKYIFPGVAIYNKLFFPKIPQNVVSQLGLEAKKCSPEKKKTWSTYLSKGTRDERGIKKFINIFLLSPEPFKHKIRIFIKPYLYIGIIRYVIERVGKLFVQ